jgi:hypothetical protein
MFIINYTFCGAGTNNVPKVETYEKERLAIDRYKDLQTQGNVYGLCLSKSFAPCQSAEAVEVEFRNAIRKVMERAQGSLDSVVSMVPVRAADGEADVVVTVPEVKDSAGHVIRQAAKFRLGPMSVGPRS